MDAIGRVIDTLKSEDYDCLQAKMLLQVMAIDTPGMSTAVAAFLQQMSNIREPSDPNVLSKFMNSSPEAYLKRLKAHLQS